LEEIGVSVIDHDIVVGDLRLAVRDWRVGKITGTGQDGNPRPSFPRSRCTCYTIFRALCGPMLFS
jgi:hypothetical protein